MFWSNSVGLREDFIFLPQLPIDFSYFPVGIAVRTLLFGRIFAKFGDLGVVQVGDQVLRLSAELDDLLRLAQVLKKGFLVFVFLELLDQLLDLVLACCILLPDCRKRYSRYSWLCESCEPYCEFDFSTTRGILGVQRTFW